LLDLRSEVQYTQHTYIVHCILLWRVSLTKSKRKLSAHTSTPEKSLFPVPLPKIGEQEQLNIAIHSSNYSSQDCNNRHYYIHTNAHVHSLLSITTRNPTTHARNTITCTSVERGPQTLRQACYRENPESAVCVQNLNDSRGFAIRITYRISLRSSSLWEPRHPPLKVVMYIYRLLHAQSERVVRHLTS
jgi:hypothetical protein